VGPERRVSPSSGPGLEAEELEMIRSLERETDRAFRFFRTLEPGPVVAMFGSSRLPSSDPVCRFARTFGEVMSREGVRVLAGGHDGAMGAALSGAGRWGTALEWDPASGDPHETDRRLVFRHLFLRKHFFLRKIRAVVLFPGGYGTMDELFELLALRQVNDWAGIPAFCAESPERPFWRPFWDGLSVILKSAPYLPVDAECPLPIESDPDRLGARVLAAVRAAGS
jgi:predicted Rossmann-fold nucleotide-binding protein